MKKPRRTHRPSRPKRLPLPRRPLEWGLAVVAVALVAPAITSLGGGSSSSAAASRRTATVGKGVVQSTVSGNGTLDRPRRSNSASAPPAKSPRSTSRRARR